MEISTGMIVKSVSGHDSGSWYAVIKCEDGFAYIADGRRRKAANPKKKNIRHLLRTKSFIKMENITDNKLRRELHSLNFGVGNNNP